jgi:single-strand DNA-binding protein
MNKILLVCNLVKDVETRQTNTSSFCIGTIAVNRAYKNKEGNIQVDYIDFLCFGNSQSYLTQFSHKGDRIEIVGRLETQNQMVGEKKIKKNVVIVESVQISVVGKNKTTHESFVDTTVDNSSYIDDNPRKTTEPVDDYDDMPF